MNKKILLLIAALVLLITICFCPLAYLWDIANPPPIGSSIYRASAIDICEKFVKGKLRNPSTAKFTYSPRPIVETDDNITFVVSSSIRAQDSDGRWFKVDCGCVVKYVGENQWNLISLWIGDQRW
jgi:hypothetical protein